MYMDAARSAREAGYSAKTAKHIGYQLLREDQVQCVIHELIEKQSDRLALKSDDILLGLLRIAAFDPFDIFNDNGTLKQLSQIPPEIRKSIAGMKWKDGKLEELKLPDKVRSYELLGKHKRLFADVQVLEGEVTLRERIALGRRRALKRRQDDESSDDRK